MDKNNFEKALVITTETICSDLTALQTQNPSKIVKVFAIAFLYSLVFGSWNILGLFSVMFFPQYALRIASQFVDVSYNTPDTRYVLAMLNATVYSWILYSWIGLIPIILANDVYIIFMERNESPIVIQKITSYLQMVLKDVIKRFSESPVDNLSKRLSDVLFRYIFQHSPSKLE